MNPALALYVVGWLLALSGAFQLIPAALALALGEPVLPFIASAAMALGAGMLLARTARVQDWTVRPRDGYLIVAAGWISVSAFGALPYLLTGAAGPVDALFESVSGFTTTGSTILTSIETQPWALLLWRSMTQWLGGMGIILFAIALLPLLGIGGMQLFKAEVSGPATDKIRPRIVETARSLWFIYVGLTLVEGLLLLAAGLGPFDAVCHALTTMASGGFSTRDASIAAFESPAVEWIVTLFMLLAGVNFVVHYRILTGRFGAVWRDGELRYFVMVVALATVVIGLTLIGHGAGLADAIRQATFQVASIVTTTGFASTDFELWPPFTHVVIVLLMMLGGMAGSTSGGIKSLRAVLGLRAFRAAFGRLLHPRAVRSVKYGGRSVDEEVLSGIWAFLTAYYLIAAATAAVITLWGYDLETAVSAALTALGNVGPGLGEVGALDTFAHFPAPVKLLLAFCMLAGRLEVFTLLVLFSPGFWRR